MSDKSTAKTMFSSLCATYEGSKNVREAKALMRVHQYELFKMKDDESIEQMYSRFLTLVSRLQILKKSYVASDHVSEILRSLPAWWRPKFTTIEETKPAKKVKSIALPSKVKSSKAFKVVEFEDESPDGDSDEDPTEKMVMHSNKLEYLAKKNGKFLSKRGGYKSFKKEDQKGCFNCKKLGHFIVECLDLQKEKSKDKSKKLRK